MTTPPPGGPGLEAPQPGPPVWALVLGEIDGLLEDLAASLRVWENPARRYADRGAAAGAALHSADVAAKKLYGLRADLAAQAVAEGLAKLEDFQ